MCLSSFSVTHAASAALPSGYKRSLLLLLLATKVQMNYCSCSHFIYCIYKVFRIRLDNVNQAKLVQSCTYLSRASMLPISKRVRKHFWVLVILLVAVVLSFWVLLVGGFGVWEEKRGSFLPSLPVKLCERILMANQPATETKLLYSQLSS